MKKECNEILSKKKAELMRIFDEKGDIDSSMKKNHYDLYNKFCSESINPDPEISGIINKRFLEMI